MPAHTDFAVFLTLERATLIHLKILSETYSEPSQTSKRFFAKIVIAFSC